MKNSFKDTVTLIQKMARSVPTTDQTQAPTPAQAAQTNHGLPPPADEPEGFTSKLAPTPNVFGNGKSVLKSSAVKDMQFAIIKLANTISESIDYNSLQQAMSRQPEAQESPRKIELISDYNTDAFSNFMVIKYLRDSDIKGSEYDTDPQKTKMDDKNPSELKSMFVILDSLKRIGTGGSEFQPDGIWGPKTNNALKNVRAIAYGVMKLGPELGMKSDVFDANKLSELSSLIPEKDSDINYANKESRAKQITPLLNGANALYLDYKNQVFTKPAYKRFFEGVPFLKVEKGKDKLSINYNGDEEAIFNNLLDYTKLPNTSFKIDIPEIRKTVEINALDLSSNTTFQEWAKKYQEIVIAVENDPSKWQSIAQDILNEVSEKASQAANALRRAQSVQSPGF